MSGHTPTPWELVRGHNGHDIIGSPWGDGRQHDGMLYVARTDVSSHYRPDAETDANAQFIVLAVNAHDALVSALRSIVAKADAAGHDSPELGKARAALALVDA